MKNFKILATNKLANYNVFPTSEDLLIEKLKYRNIFISKEELRDVANLYNTILDLYYDINKEEKDRKIFEYILTSTDFLLKNNQPSYELFELAIEIYQKKLTKYIDYVYMRDYLFVGGLIGFMLEILHKGGYQDGETIQHIIDSNISAVDNIDIDEVNDSKILSPKYKEILSLYDKLYFEYYETDYEDDYFDDDISFCDFIHVTYYYFLENELFTKDPDGILNFLSKVFNSIQDYIYRLNMFCVDNTKEMYQFIDMLYQTKDKMIIK